jgi:tetratricopeptide (TPR) repeat protein
MLIWSVIMFGSLFANKDKLKLLFIDAWQQGDLRQAAKLGEKLVAKAPDDFENVHDLGMVYFQAGVYDAALHCLTEANKIHEKSTHWNNIGRVYQAIKDFKQARKSYDKARELDSADPQPWYNLTVCFREEGNMQAAFDELKQIIKVHPQHLGSRSDLGLHLEQRGQIDEAIEQFEAALAIDPEYYPARENMILALCDQGESKRVISLLDYYKTQGLSVEIETSTDDKITHITINGSQFYSQ